MPRVPSLKTSTTVAPLTLFSLSFIPLFCFTYHYVLPRQSKLHFFRDAMLGELIWQTDWLTNNTGYIVNIHNICIKTDLAEQI